MNEWKKKDNKEINKETKNHWVRQDKTQAYCVNTLKTRNYDESGPHTAWCDSLAASLNVLRR